MLLLWTTGNSKVCPSSGLRWDKVRENLSIVSKPEKQRVHTHTSSTLISYTYNSSLPEETVSK
jgi:hypothetical protein